jgi:hypothetical protein
MSDIPAKPKSRTKKSVVYSAPEPDSVSVPTPIVQVKPKKTKKSVPVETVAPVAPVSPVVKAKRTPSAYNLFVKEALQREEVKALPPRERFGKISEIYKSTKST